MKYLICLLVGLSFLCNSVILYSQCRCTIEELKTITSGKENMDPIVGLYVLSSNNIKINDQDEISYSRSENLSTWVIKPYEDHFQVCHTELTKYTNSNTKIFKLDNGNYLYKSLLRTGEIVVAELRLDDNGLNYSIQVPQKLYDDIYPLEKDFVKTWSFDWRKVPLADDYENIISDLDLSLYPSKEETSFKGFTSSKLYKKLRELTSIPGYYHIAEYLNNGKFKIQSSYSIYPKVQTLVISFQDVDMSFEVDIYEQNNTPFSIRPIIKNNRLKLNELSKYFKSIQKLKLN